MRAWEVFRACCGFQFGSLFQWLQHVNLGSMLKAGFWTSACFSLNKWNGQHKSLSASPAEGWHLSSMVHSVCAEHTVHLVLQSRAGYLFSVEVTIGHVAMMSILPVLSLPWVLSLPSPLHFWLTWDHSAERWCLCGAVESSLLVCVFLKLLYSMSSGRKASQTLPKCCGNFWCSALLNDV